MWINAIGLAVAFLAVNFAVLRMLGKPRASRIWEDDR